LKLNLNAEVAEGRRVPEKALWLRLCCAVFSAFYLLQVN
jgi:hypothetical protein